MEIKQLEKELQERRRDESLIRAKIGKFCYEKYGITDFFSKVDSALPAFGGLQICLARQIATVNVEHLSKRRLATMLNQAGIPTQPLALSFTQDRYAGLNSLKVSYCKTKQVRHTGNGFHFQMKSLVPKSYRCGLEGCTLGNIQTFNGRMLPDYHSELRLRVLGKETPTADLSELFRLCLMDSLKSGIGCPGEVYIQSGNKQKLQKLAKVNGSTILRPQASWYYLFHLLMFVDGKRALLETWNDDDPHVVEWFESSIKTIEQICGYKPLILKIPHRITIGEHNFSLEELPVNVMSNQNWRDKIIPPRTQNTLHAFTDFAKQFLELQ